ncbi:caspase family protein [Bradyrhizobium sp. LjRoot220]|uniref:caspase family protein n=1 Tax=Bradyrhizobium sp. LjRoot220 TaxID=3342284 RepID=UPI003ECF271F
MKIYLALLLTVIFSAASIAPSFGAGERFALVIGNTKYPDAEAGLLKEPINDARDVAEQLRRGGFTVDIGENLTGDGMRRAFERLYGKVKPGSVALIFFSGFGVQSSRQSYMIPVDASIWTEPDVRRDGFSLETVLSELNSRGAAVKIVLIDASRRNPFERRFRSYSAGLAPVIAPGGTLVMYSTALSSVVPDKISEQGLFVRELLKEIRAPEVLASEALQRVRTVVIRASRSEQVPWISDSLTENFFFLAKAPLPGSNPTPPAALPPVVAQPLPQPPTPPEIAAAPIQKPAVVTQVPSINPEKRVALVIGNSAYRNVARLPNPQHDAATVAAALRQVGFQSVMLQTDLGLEKTLQALRDFARAADGSDWAVVYFAGHGIEVGGVNYLIPVDAALTSDRDVSLEAIALDQVLTVIARASKLRVVILDACRNNPFDSQMKRTVALRAVSRGLARVEPNDNTIVAYAAKHGETASDGDSSNSPFTAALVKNLQTPGLEIRRLFDTVRDDVMDLTDRRQQPFSYGSVTARQNFYFLAPKS